MMEQRGSRIFTLTNYEDVPDLGEDIEEEDESLFHVTDTSFCLDTRVSKKYLIFESKGKLLLVILISMILGTLLLTELYLYFCSDDEPDRANNVDVTNYLDLF